jgi:hypothetical protein
MYLGDFPDDWLYTFSRLGICRKKCRNQTIFFLSLVSADILNSMVPCQKDISVDLCRTMFRLLKMERSHKVVWELPHGIYKLDPKT